MTFVVVIAVISTYSGLVRGYQWKTEQGIAAMILRDYQHVPDFQLERMLYGNAAFVRRNADFLRTHSLSVFAAGESAVPPEVQAYQAPPVSLLSVMERYPDDRAALQRLWEVYCVGADLRDAFDVSSNEFGRNLIRWAYGATRDGGHYLSVYLRDYSAQYSRLWEQMESEPR